MRKQLLKRFRYSVREQGRADYERGCVRDVEVSHGHVRGVVSEGPVESEASEEDEEVETAQKEYSVEIYFEEDIFQDKPQLISRCACTTQELQSPCHHQWAVIEYCQKEGILKRLADEFVPSALWRSRIEQLERAGRRREINPWTEIGEFHGRIRYLFDISLSMQSEFVYLTCEWQKKNRQGGWNQAKRLATDVPGRDSMGDADDRKITELLQPFHVLESAEFSAARRMGRSCLPPAAVIPLMRLVCSTGRLYATNGNRISTEPLTWDPEPWKITPRVDRSGMRLVFDYVVRRGEEECIELTADMFLTAGDLLFTGRGFIVIESSPPWHVLESVILGGPIEVPTREEARLLQATASLMEEQAESDDQSPVLDESTPTPILEIDTEKEALDAYRCKVSFAYGDQVIPAEDRQQVVFHGANGSLSGRSTSFERRALRSFLEAGGELAQVHENAPPHPVVPIRRLAQVSRALVEDAWRLELSGSRVHSSGRTNFAIASGIDWFDVSGSMQFEGAAIALPDILAATKRGLQFLELPDGSLGLLPEEGSKQWSLVERLGRVEGDAMRFAKNQGWLLDALLSSRESEVDVDAGFEALRERITAVTKAEPLQETPGFCGELRAYQREGMGWIKALRGIGLGGCLADDMGLGKTVQVLAALEARRIDDSISRPSIVVAPKSLTFNWAREANRFAPQLRVITYAGPDRTEQLAKISESDLVITTYGTLRRDIEALSEIHFDYAILDEAQAIKNSASLISKAVRLVTADHRLALSGTPIENHLGELWSLFEFLNPGMLGRSTSFKRLFIGKRADRITDEERSRIAHAMRPFILRRTKEEVLTDLPEKSEQTIFCDLTEQQRKDYDEIRDYYRASLLGRSDSFSTLPKMHVLEALLRLRQASCHPSLLDPERMDEPSAKFEVLVPMLEELREEGHKALVFSQFTRHLAALQHILDQREFKYTYLDGRTRKREERVDRFQNDPDCTLFLISLKAGGYGLNLTAADYVFLLDPWWNPATESQAINRSHRIGQTRKVMAYRLISRNTTEEKVLELQARKRDLAEAILSRDKSVLRDMTREDLELLLS